MPQSIGSHPGWRLAICFSVLFYCFVHFLPVDGISILHDLDFFGINLTDDTDAKSWSREWLTENKFFRDTKLKSGFSYFVLEKISEWLNDFFEINEIRKSSYIVVRLDYG